MAANPNPHSWSDLQVEYRAIGEVQPREGNPRTHSAAQVEQIAASMREFGFTTPLLIDADGTIIAGHGRYMAALQLRLARVPTIELGQLSPEQIRAYVIADNKLALNAGWDMDLLAFEIDALKDLAFDTALLGFNPEELETIDLYGRKQAGEGEGAGGSGQRATGNLADRFLVAPFSVMNAREGWWQDRKRAWIALGLRSEVGRGRNTLGFSDAANAGYAKLEDYRLARAFDTEGNIAGAQTGTSIFDPVLCEIAYRWFCPPGGLVLDPFAGGSVRGIVAGKLGRAYTGIDLRPEQIEANREQAAAIMGERAAPIAAGMAAPAGATGPASPAITDPSALTPVERRGEIWVKRDDLFDCNGARGGKARATLALLRGAAGAVGAGNRLSPMLSRVARVAEFLGIPCRGHASGAAELSPEEKDAVAHGAELVKIKGTNYLTAIRSRAAKDAQARGWVFVPFGLESREYFEQTKAQVANVPAEARRIVVTAGSGMTVAAICAGLRDRGLRTPILAVRVGLDPEPLIDRWAPADWRSQITIVQAPASFETPEARTNWWGIDLDPHYEAKAAPFVQPGDCFWDIAIRSELAAPAAGKISSPPKPSEEALTIEHVMVPRPGGDLPSWAQGFDVGALKQLASLYKQQDEPYVLGAFTGTKEAQLAEALAAEQLLGAYRGDDLVAAVQVLKAKARSTIEDFAGRACGAIEAGDVQLRRLMCKEGEADALRQLIDHVSAMQARTWLETWQECPAHTQVARAAGFTWISAKVRASSEIVGLWTSGGILRDGQAPPVECCGLVRLRLPPLPTQALAARIIAGDLPAFADHYSTYNKRHSWSALALRGYGGDPSFIIKPSEMSKQWRADHPETAALAIEDTPLMDQLPEARALMDAIPGVKHRVRLMQLAPDEGELTRHADITDPDAGVAPHKLLRIHIPIITNPGVEFTQWLIDGSCTRAHMAEGEAWYLDTRKPHRAINTGHSARVHLVIDVESSPELLALLPLDQAAEATAPAGDALAITGDAIRPQWIEGDSRDLPTLLPADVQADFLFSCPPYADLERYSDDPRDLSTLDYPAFRASYFEIIAKACARLRDDRFACFVVGEVRDDAGQYYDFVGDTVQAFRDAGLAYYNEAILITAVGSLAIRAAGAFSASRKLGKTHQNVLIFCKGDARRATAACGPVEIDLPDGMASEEGAP